MDEQLFRMKPVVLLTDITSLFQYKNLCHPRYKRFSCRACKVVCWSKEEIAAHVIKDHDNTCNLCGKRFTKSGYRLYKHWKNRHRKGRCHSVKSRIQDGDEYLSANADEESPSTIKQDIISDDVEENEENRNTTNIMSFPDTVKDGRQAMIANNNREAVTVNDVSPVIGRLLLTKNTNSGSSSSESWSICSLDSKSSNTDPVQDMPNREDTPSVIPKLTQPGNKNTVSKLNASQSTSTSPTLSNSAPRDTMKLSTKDGVSAQSRNPVTPVRAPKSAVISAMVQPVIRNLESFQKQPLKSPAKNASSSFTTPGMQNLMTVGNQMTVVNQSSTLPKHIHLTPPVINCLTTHAMPPAIQDYTTPITHMASPSITTAQPPVNPTSQFATQFNQSSVLNASHHAQGFAGRNQHYQESACYSHVNKLDSSTLVEETETPPIQYFEKTNPAPPTFPAPSFERRYNGSQFSTSNNQSMITSPDTMPVDQYYRPPVRLPHEPAHCDHGKSSEQQMPYLWCCLCQRPILNHLTAAHSHLLANHRAFLVNHSKWKRNQTSPNPYVCISCPHCTFKTADAEQLALHIATEHAITMLKCDQCDYQTLFTEMLDEHKNTYHSLLTCKYCQLKLRSSTALLEHLNDNHYGIS